MDAAAAAAAAMREESEEAETAETAEREPSTDDDDETEEEMEAREREEKSERNKVSRRVFGAETDTRATTWTRSLFMLGAIFVFLAAYPKFVGWLCSYFEPLDTAVSAYEALTSNVGLDLRIMRATSTATFKVVALCAVITGLMREGKLPLETPVVVSKLAFNVMLPAYSVYARRGDAVFVSSHQSVGHLTDKCDGASHIWIHHRRRRHVLRQPLSRVRVVAHAGRRRLGRGRRD